MVLLSGVCPARELPQPLAHLSGSRSYVWDRKTTETGLLLRGAGVWKERHTMDKTTGQMRTPRHRGLTSLPTVGHLVSGQAASLAVGPGTPSPGRAPHCPGGMSGSERGSELTLAGQDFHKNPPDCRAHAIDHQTIFP